MMPNGVACRCIRPAGRASEEIVAHIVAARHQWKWGSRKLRVKLAAPHRSIVRPAESTIGEGVKRAGLTHARGPRVIHTGNGVPFASRAPSGLSRVSMEWVRLGIVSERSRAASPQDNGRHERMHSTLKHPPERNARRSEYADDMEVRRVSQQGHRP